MTVPAPGPYDWRRIGRAGSHGLYNIFLTDKDGRKIAAVWGRPDEKEATADLLAAAPDLLAAAVKLEEAEIQHSNCPECEGDEIPEHCAVCFPAFDAARRTRRAAISRARGENRG